MFCCVNVGLPVEELRRRMLLVGRQKESQKPMYPLTLILY